MKKRTHVITSFTSLLSIVFLTSCGRIRFYSFGGNFSSRSSSVETNRNGDDVFSENKEDCFTSVSDSICTSLDVFLSDSENVQNSSFSSREGTLFDPLSFPSTVLLNEGEADLFFSSPDMWTQGMCISNVGDVFLTQCSDSQGQYYISKINSNGTIVETSISTFNHANGMSYNGILGKLYVCKFAAESGTDGCDRSCDYSFYVVDEDTFAIEEEIDLYEVVTSVCPGSLGIGGIAFDETSGKLCVFTRKPERHVIFLNEDYSYESSVFLCEDNGDVLFGDISLIDDYFVTCYWNWSDLNVVDFYDMLGNCVKSIELYGVTHIESIDFYNNNLFANFNDFSNNIDTRVFVVEG